MSIMRVGNVTFVGGVRVVRGDVLMENGVVHVLDGVIGDGGLDGGPGGEVVARAEVDGRSEREGDGGVDGVLDGSVVARANRSEDGNASASVSRPITLATGAAVEPMDFAFGPAFGPAFGVLGVWVLWMFWWM